MHWTDDDSGAYAVAGGCWTLAITRLGTKFQVRLDGQVLTHRTKDKAAEEFVSLEEAKRAAEAVSLGRLQSAVADLRETIAAKGGGRDAVNDETGRGPHGTEGIPRPVVAGGE